MTHSTANSESYNTLRWVLENAQNGFYLYTASHPMQRRVAEYFSTPDIAIYDYSRNNAPYSFSTLAQWAMQQKAKAFFVINMQVALREDKDRINLNLSRDLLTKIDGIWIFGMTPDTDDRLTKIAYDFYSFVRIQAHFEDEGVERETPAPIVENLPSDKYYDSYQDAAEQMQRYASLCEELLALPLTTEADRLQSAAITLGNIAELYYNYGRYDDAMRLYTRVKAIREKVLGKEHPSTATTYNNIASVYWKQGSYDKSLEWYQKALAIREMMLGKEHPSTATTYNNIAGVYDDQGDYDKALEWYQKDLAISEKVLGKEHPGSAVKCNNIAVVYRNQGKYDEALEWLKKALAVREKVLGKEHPDTASTYGNIANVYLNQGDYEEALEWYWRALAVYEKVLGREHPDTAITYNNIAAVYDDLGNFDEALEWYQKALGIREKKFGEDHPHTKRVRDHMAGVHERMDITGGDSE